MLSQPGLFGEVIPVAVTKCNLSLFSIGDPDLGNLILQSDIDVTLSGIPDLVIQQTSPAPFPGGPKHAIGATLRTSRLIVFQFAVGVPDFFRPCCYFGGE